jgi:murein DD-endopeptidase MepM/ murein hydrolase activator NlpD
MARMRTQTKHERPHLAHYLEEALPGAFGDPRLIEPFLRHSGLSRTSARVALTRFNTNPWIDVRPLGLGHANLPALGLFDPALRNRIAIAEDVAERFEVDHGLAPARETVLALVLHEMVHWGDFFDDIQAHGDPGAAFEFEAYGERHGRWYDFTLPSMGNPGPNRFVFPVTGHIGRRSSHWGPHVRAGGTRAHAGIDVFNAIGTPVHAMADGEVLPGNRYRTGEARRAETGNYGQMVDIDHGNGLVSRYAHLDTVEALPGAVSRGQRIGTLGATGTDWGLWLHQGQPTPQPPPNATPPHLHLEMRAADGPAFGFEGSRDPALFFDFLEPGIGARDTAVRALAVGVELPSPARRPALIADEAVAAMDGARAGANVPAFPNSSFGPNAKRGLRNNNPGNLVRDGTEWAGLRTAAFQLDPDFHQFIEMKWGIRAMARTLKTYQRQHHLDTLRAISERWAPRADGNDPLAHARHTQAASRGQVASIDAQIDLRDEDTLFGAIRGIMVAENGRDAEVVSDDTVREGIELEKAA